MSVSKISIDMQYTLPAVFDDSLTYYEAVAKLMAKCNEIIDYIDTLNSSWESMINDAIDTSKAYTDKQLSAYNTQFNAIVNNLNAQYTAFIAQVNTQLSTFNNRLTTQEDKEAADVINLTNLISDSIEANNNYILSEMTTELANIKVVNYFTGELISVQDMFNYLCMFHAENAISYSTMESRNKTYTQYADFNITYGQLALNGNLLFV